MDATLHEEAVENLVTQFSSSLDFYRELVQNSIDAGSSSVDVWMEFEAGEGVEGVISIHVDDYGEGMNEEIIDQQLTKLFSSTKENDLTKIGKFGIGFVSVFALRPQGVLIQTGRDGECWEVFFHEDRSFNKGKLDTPVEGTQITLFVEGGRSRYRELVAGSRETLAKWCAHSDTEISFEDRSADQDQDHDLERINAPFEVESDCRVRVAHPGTEISVGFTRTPAYGFYNKGLALAVTTAGNTILEGRASRFEHIAFKIKSRYLEHTLSRETVMRDENYEKAMALLEQAVEYELREELLGAIEALCEQPEWSLTDRADYDRLIGFLSLEPRTAFGPLGPRRLLRSVDGKAHAMHDALGAMQREGRVLVAPASSELTARLAKGGIPVFVGGAARGAAGSRDRLEVVLASYLAAESRLGAVGFFRETIGLNLLSAYLEKIVHPESVMVAVTPARSLPDNDAALLRNCAATLEHARMGYEEIVGGKIEGRPEAPQLFALGRELGPVMALPPRGVYVRGLLLERPKVLVNVLHPHFRELAQLHAVDPALGAYCLAKAVLLDEDRKLDEDPQLILSAQEVAS